MLDRSQIREFARDGFVVVPRVIPAELLAAATRAVDALVEREPPSAGTRGPHFYFRPSTELPEVAALLTGSSAFSLAESLTAPQQLEVPWQVQVALNIPPFPAHPGRPHLDGYPPESDGRPGTFTVLAAVLLSDQLAEDAGNLWVWPGTHVSHAAYFREHGPDAFLQAGGYPPIDLPEPRQIRGRAGDLVLAHYLTGHNIGGNTSRVTRRAVYLRLKSAGHEARWRQVLQDPWLEFDRAPLGTA